MPKLAIRMTFACVLLVMLVGIHTEVWTWKSLIDDSDFTCYYTAACLVRGHLNSYIYEEARQGVDPTQHKANPKTVFARTASAHGITLVSLYDYPPTLADLVVPLTFISPFKAMFAWFLINVAALLAAIVMLMRMIGMEFPGFARFGLFFLVIAIFRPVLDCFYYGQMPILLLFLLIAGLRLYEQDKKTRAALLFALAFAIKLTPLIIVIPLIAWRDWKTLRAFAIWCGVILGAILLINGPSALSQYFLHEMPAISSGEVSWFNLSFATTVQIFWSGPGVSVPLAGVAWAGRLLSFAALLYAGWLSRLKDGEMLLDSQRLRMVAAFLILSCCLSPVAWIHAYVLSIPLWMIIGQRMWRGRATAFETVLGIWVFLSLTSDKLFGLGDIFRMPFFFYLAVMTPVIAVFLGIMELSLLGRERDLMQGAHRVEAAASARFAPVQ